MSFISYFITPSNYPLNKIFESIKFHKPTFVCYRNKSYFDKDEIIKFATFSKKFSKVFINIDDLKDESLIEYFDGVHLTSSKLNLVEDFKDKIVISSTHSIEEVIKAKNSDYITFSPIFDSKGRKGLGVDILDTLPHNNILALGGITSNKEVEEVKKTKAKGFASIRYFLI